MGPFAGRDDDLLVLGGVAVELEADAHTVEPTSATTSVGVKCGNGLPSMVTERAGGIGLPSISLPIASGRRRRRRLDGLQPAHHHAGQRGRPTGDDDRDQWTGDPATRRRLFLGPVPAEAHPARVDSFIIVGTTAAARLLRRGCDAGRDRASSSPGPADGANRRPACRSPPVLPVRRVREELRLLGLFLLGRNWLPRAVVANKRRGQRQSERAFATLDEVPLRGGTGFGDAPWATRELAQTRVRYPGATGDRGDGLPACCCSAGCSTLSEVQGSADFRDAERRRTAREPSILRKGSADDAKGQAKDTSDQAKARQRPLAAGSGDLKGSGRRHAPSSHRLPAEHPARRQRRQ